MGENIVRDVLKPLTFTSVTRALPQGPNNFGSFPNQPGPRTFTYYPNESLRRLWQEAKDEIAMTEPDPAQFKNQTLPLARIKKVGGAGVGAGPRCTPCESWPLHVDWRASHGAQLKHTVPSPALSFRS